jgi:hypothetical protein
MMSGAIWVRDMLAAAGWQVQIAHARKVPMWRRWRAKPTRPDARVLAELCRRDLVPRLWVPSLGDREFARAAAPPDAPRAYARVGDEPHLRPAHPVGTASVAAPAARAQAHGAARAAPVPEVGGGPSPRHCRSSSSSMRASPRSIARRSGNGGGGRSGWRRRRAARSAPWRAGGGARHVRCRSCRLLRSSRPVRDHDRDNTMATTPNSCNRRRRLPVRARARRLQQRRAGTGPRARGARRCHSGHGGCVSGGAVDGFAAWANEPTSR